MLLKIVTSCLLFLSIQLQASQPPSSALYTCQSFVPSSDDSLDDMFEKGQFVSVLAPKLPAVGTAAAATSAPAHHLFDATNPFLAAERFLAQQTHAATASPPLRAPYAGAAAEALAHTTREKAVRIPLVAKAVSRTASSFDLVKHEGDGSDDFTSLELDESLLRETIQNSNLFQAMQHHNPRTTIPTWPMIVQIHNNTPAHIQHEPQHTFFRRLPLILVYLWHLNSDLTRLGEPFDALHVTRVCRLLYPIKPQASEAVEAFVDRELQRIANWTAVHQPETYSQMMTRLQLQRAQRVVTDTVQTVASAASAVASALLPR